MRVVSSATAALRLTGRRLGGDYPEDEWGFDPGFRDAAQVVLAPLEKAWWRVRSSGAQHVPATGPALVVANHAGLVPADAAMIARALGRWPRTLLPGAAFEHPFASVAARRLGAVPDSAANAARLLAEGHVVVAFPEAETAFAEPKPCADRYRVRRVDRGDVVVAAVRAGAPVVPCAVVGAEETYPRIGVVPGIGLPVTPTFPLLGPAGLAGLPARWRIAFGGPLALAALTREPGDPAALLEATEAIRARLQELVQSELVLRPRTFG